MDTDDFHSQTPIGDIAMKNIIAKIPGTGQGILLLLTHYDTLRLDGFVGAEDGGSSTGLMLEMARSPAAARSTPIPFGSPFSMERKRNKLRTARLSGLPPTGVYGSRELAASLAVSGDLKRVRAVILADMVGQKGLQLPREESSTGWLTDLVWSTAARLGYANIFSNLGIPWMTITSPFLHRGVAATDVIDAYGYQQLADWHTTQDTLDKISPRNLAIVGHVILESVAELQKKFQ